MRRPAYELALVAGRTTLAPPGVVPLGLICRFIFPLQQPGYIDCVQRDIR